jgi:predicted transcriptional regulator
VGAVVPQVRIFDLENAKYLLEQGWTQKQIAKEQGVSAATVWRYLTSAGARNKAYGAKPPHRSFASCGMKDIQRLKSAAAWG